MKHVDVQTIRSASRAMKLLRGKWTVQILGALLDGPVRLSELRRDIPGASKKALTATLRSLEKAKIVSRRDLSKSVLHVEYELVELDQVSVLDLMHLLAEFERGTAGPTV